MRIALLALLLVVGCESATMPDGALAFTPPASYTRWFGRAESCSGRQGDFARVRWFWYDRERVPDIYGSGASAVTWLASHRIAIARPYLSDSTTVIHEALHDIWQTTDHPADVFGGHCAPMLKP